MFKGFFSDRSGNFGVLTAILLVPVIGVAGVALDLSNALMVRSTLQAAADAAALAAVSETSAGVSQALQMQSDGQLSAAIADAKKVFLGHAKMSEHYELKNFDVDVVKTG
ncbi:MAG: pilus assembly protein TadG-related protein [Rhizobium sp.]|nr:pilus assembly protein TadG-related protein [Rhizobium sp.]MCZ8352435.1 pilus assembly protein TadG-related protein [Rhizobium sp.]